MLSVDTMEPPGAFREAGGLGFTAGPLHLHEALAGRSGQKEGHAAFAAVPLLLPQDGGGAAGRLPVCPPPAPDTGPCPDALHWLAAALTAAPAAGEVSHA